MDLSNAILDFSQKLLSTPGRELDYRSLTRSICRLSGAKFGIFNIYSADGRHFRNAAVCGSGKLVNTAYKLLGFSLQDKEWKTDELRVRQIRGGEPVKFDNLHELAKGVLSKNMCKAIEKVTQTQNIYVIEIAYAEQTLGDFILLFDKGKEIENVSYVKTCANMTGIAIQRRVAEQNILRDNEKIRESDRLKSAFLANMSHEIRTPMNAIIGFASFITEEGKSPEEIRQFANIIMNSGQHLLNLINDIIDISKIDSGEISVSPAEADINDVLGDVYGMFQSEISTLQKQGVDLFLRTPEKELQVITDETRLRQILINLIGNALKFTKEGFVEFGYRLSGKELLFYVKDTGAGIAEEHHATIFKRFSQVNSQAKKSQGGTGLGLAIAKACTEILGGRIWLESAQGEGSTFYFTIAFEPVTRKQAPVRRVITKNTQFGGKHILIAEDDDLSFKYLAEILKRYNLKISRTVDGSETVETVLNNDDIDLVLMDIHMPVIDGLEATRTIRESKPDLPVIAQTAYAFTDDRKKSLEAGCVDYISKPILSADLVALISKYLNGK